MDQTPAHRQLIAGTFPLSRPATLALCARIGAGRYRRSRDLPGAVPGLLSGDSAAILPRLVAEENRCEEKRLSQDAAYRPAVHVQILSALLAEAAACQRGTASDGAPARPPAGTAAAAPAAPSLAPDRMQRRRPALPARRRQANASGSEALRSVM